VIGVNPRLPAFRLHSAAVIAATRDAGVAENE